MLGNRTAGRFSLSCGQLLNTKVEDKMMRSAQIFGMSVIAALVLFSGLGHPNAAMTTSGEMIIVPEYVEAEKIVEQGNYKDAIVLLNQTLQKFPGHANAWNLLGFSHRMMGNFDDAEKYYDGALTINPTHTGALNYIGQLFIQTGRIEKAKGMLVKLESACPQGCKDLEHLKKAVSTGVAGNY